MGIRYIVTGAAGHLGSTVIRLLQNTDSEVYGLLKFLETAGISCQSI